MLEVKKLKADLAAELGIIVDEKDPIFATVFLNEKVLQHHIDNVNNEQDKIINKVASLHELQKNNMLEALAKINKDQESRFKKYLNHVKDNQIESHGEQNIANQYNSFLYTILGLLVGILVSVAYYNIVN